MSCVRMKRAGAGVGFATTTHACVWRQESRGSPKLAVSVDNPNTVFTGWALSEGYLSAVAYGDGEVAADESAELRSSLSFSCRGRAAAAGADMA
jgi:hypothetical protein